MKAVRRLLYLCQLTLASSPNPGLHNPVLSSPWLSPRSTISSINILQSPLWRRLQSALPPLRYVHRHWQKPTNVGEPILPFNGEGGDMKKNIARTCKQPIISTNIQSFDEYWLCSLTANSMIFNSSNFSNIIASAAVWRECVLWDERPFGNLVMNLPNQDKIQYGTVH